MPAKKPNENTEGVIFIRKLSASLKNQYKAWCSRRGLTMKDALVAHMTKCVEDDNKVLQGKKVS